MSEKFIFVLGGDSFASAPTFSVNEEYFNALSLFGTNLFYDHSSSYLYSRELCMHLYKNNILQEENIFIKTPPSLRHNLSPRIIYDYFLSELTNLSLHKCSSLFLNKPSDIEIVDFLESTYYQKLIDDKLISSISLILGSNMSDRLQEIVTTYEANITNISILSNYFSIFEATEEVNQMFTILVRSIFSSGIISRYLKQDRSKDYTFNDFKDLPELEQRLEYLYTLTQQGLLTKENCFHFPLHLSKANGLILATKKSEHLIETYKLLSSHQIYIAEHKDALKSFSRIINSIDFKVQNE